MRPRAAAETRYTPTILPVAVTVPRADADRCAALLRQQGFVFLDCAPDLSAAELDDMERALRTGRHHTHVLVYNDGRTGHVMHDVMSAWSATTRAAVFAPFVPVLDAFFGTDGWLVIPPISVHTPRGAPDQRWHRDLSVRRNLVVSFMLYTRPFHKRITTLFSAGLHQNVRRDVDHDSTAISNQGPVPAKVVAFDSYHVHRGVNNASDGALHLLTLNFVKKDITPKDWARLKRDFELPASLTRESLMSVADLY